MPRRHATGRAIAVGTVDPGLAARVAAPINHRLTTAHERRITTGPRVEPLSVIPQVLSHPSLTA